MMTKWFIVASGPSLTKEDCEKIKDQNVIVINDNYRMMPNATILYACDFRWWEHHKNKPELRAFSGEKWTQNDGWDVKSGVEPELVQWYKRELGLNFIKSYAGERLSANPELIMQGSNSGIQSINLAYHRGARLIYLLGFDMQSTSGKSHWHGDHPWGKHDDWHKWHHFYEKVAKQCPELGLEIVNLSRETALTCFPRKLLEDVL